MVRFGGFGTSEYSLLKQPFHVLRIGMVDQADAGTAWERSMTAVAMSEYMYPHLNAGKMTCQRVLFRQRGMLPAMNRTSPPLQQPLLFSRWNIRFESRTIYIAVGWNIFLALH